MDEERLPLGAGFGNPHVARSRKSFDTSVRAWVAAGTVDLKADASLIGNGRTVADALDREVSKNDPSPFHIERLTARLNAVVRSLTENRAVPTSDAAADFLHSLRSS